MIFPAILPALLTGFALAFARAVGEYGSVVFISGNMPGKSEISAAADHHQAGTVRLCRSHRHRDADADRVLRDAAGDQRAASLDEAAVMPADNDDRSRSGQAVRRSANRSGCALSLIGGRADIPGGLPAAAADPRLRRRRFGRGIGAYSGRSGRPDAVSAIQLTLMVAAIAVPLNLVFGVAAAWAIAKFEFRGKSLLITLIDLPFSVSPVISGPDLRAAVRPQGWFGPWLATTTSRSSSPCRAWCWRPSSSRSRSSPAN